MYTLNLHNIICQLHLNKAGNEELPFTLLSMKNLEFTSFKTE